MFRENISKKAFAIRFSNGKGGKFDKQGFNAFVRQLTKDYPCVQAEGITDRKRPDFNVIAELGNFGVVQKNTGKKLICVGVDERFDISLEKESDIIVGGFYRRVPIFDISKDKEEIVERMIDYLQEAYPLTYAENTHRESQQQEIEVTIVTEKQPKITYHSTFVRIDNKIVSWEIWYKIKDKYLNTTKPKAKRVNYVVEDHKRRIGAILLTVQG